MSQKLLRIVESKNQDTERKSDKLAVFVVGVEGEVRIGSHSDGDAFKQFPDTETGVPEPHCPLGWPLATCSY